MANGVFSGYNKPNFEVKNLTSDMWSPITTNNNFSAYTPPKPTQAQNASQPTGTRPTQPTSKQRVPAGERQQRPLDKKTKGNGRVQKKQKPVAPKKSPAKPKQQKAKRKTSQAERPISSGNIPQNKPVKIKTPSKMMRNLTAKRNEKTNLEFVKLRNKGKTADEARLIINRRKIRRNRIKTLSSVAVLFVFALTFLLAYSYFEGAVISKININGGDEIYTETEILEAAKLETGMNMLTVREKQVNSDVTTVLPFISKIGVPSKRSAPETRRIFPCSLSATFSNFTQDNPMGFGRKGERLAKTPTRLFPPNLGGRTVAFQPSLCAKEKSKISQRCEKLSISRKASGFLYSG